MRIKVLGGEPTKIRLKFPMFIVFSALATREEGVYILDPEEALHVIYEAIRFNKVIRELYCVEAEIGRIALKRLIKGASDIVKEAVKPLDEGTVIEIKEKSLKPLPRALEEEVMVYILGDKREFEVDKEIAKVVWLEGESVEIPIGDFILRISWAPIYYNISPDIIYIVKHRLRCSTQEVSTFNKC